MAEAQESEDHLTSMPRASDSVGPPCIAKAITQAGPSPGQRSAPGKLKTERGNSRRSFRPVRHAPTSAAEEDNRPV